MTMRAVIAGSTGLIGRNQAFNIVNGDIFRWRWHWPRVAVDFRIEAAPYRGRLIRSWQMRDRPGGWPAARL